MSCIASQDLVCHAIAQDSRKLIPPIDRHLADNYPCPMSNPKAETRLEPIMHAYLEDLAKLGAYGKGKSGVIRGFVEKGVQVALEKKVIAPRNAGDFKGGDDEENADL
jgi:hypothetical protein